MKRLFTVAAIMLVAVTASARGGFGVTAGFNYNTATIQDVQTEPRAGFSAGLTYQLDLPLGFSVQPALVYTQKSGNINMTGVGLVDKLLDGSIYQKVGSLVVPVSLQWGPDLIVARPFLDLTPYVGYALVNEINAQAAGLKGTYEGERTLDYGVGLGAGINVWRLQAIVRYNWNFGAMGSFDDFKEINLGELKTDDQTYGGITVNLAFFF
jgi:hypothetical protein